MNKLIKKVALLLPPVKRLKQRIDDMRSQINTNNIEVEELHKIIELLRPYLDLAHVKKYRSCTALERFHVNFQGKRIVNDKEEQYMAFCCENERLTNNLNIGIYDKVDESIKTLTQMHSDIIAESKIFSILYGGG